MFDPQCAVNASIDPRSAPYAQLHSHPILTKARSVTQSARKSKKP